MNLTVISRKLVLRKRQSRTAPDPVTSVGPSLTSQLAIDPRARGLLAG